MRRPHPAPGAALVLATLFLAVACGGGTPWSSEAPSDSTETAAGTATDARSPAELGEAIAILYVEAIGAVTEEMASRPTPSVLRPRLEALHERYVQELVPLGRAREALDEAGRDRVDQTVRRAVERLPTATFREYAEAQDHYFALDPALADLVARFNVITRYARYDRLRREAPEEAERLGVR